MTLVSMTVPIKSSPIEVIAVITPAESKKEQLEEVLVSIANAVQENEPNTLRYELYYTEKTGEYVFVEKYADEPTLAQHRMQEYMTSAFEVAEKNGLLAKPVEFRILSKIGGFAR